MSSYILENNTKASSSTKHLQSEIINQKKQFIFKVEQTSNFVYPNEEYKYYIYLKNISGVDINNIHILINNPSDIFIDETAAENLIEIGTMKDGEVKMIYLTASCANTGTFYTHFICYGDGTGLFYKTMEINCSYNNISDEMIHRIHIYNFTPYEDTYQMSIGDYNDQVTQLFKTQKLPYKAGAQPFPEQYKQNEQTKPFPEQYEQNKQTIRPFINTESESFVSQYDEKHLKGFADKNSPKQEIYESARNTKEHYYQYIGRENFDENSLESFEGENLFKIIQNINENSQYFQAQFLKTGTNQLLNDFREYSPNGFIYRFGLLSSEIYHHLGVLPSYSYMSDYLFRWAPSKDQPLNLIPQKKAMNWNRHKWAGQGWRVYRIATKEYMETDEWQQKFDAGLVERWSIVEDFENLQSAQDYINRQKGFDEIIKSQLSLDYNQYEYLIRESYFDNGVFYINIPLDKIPTNFYLLNNEDIEAIVQRSKPLGVKPLIRYTIERIFTHAMEFSHYPKLKPYIEINIDDMGEMTYLIQSKKYKNIVEEICDESISSIKLIPSGKTILYKGIFDNNMDFYKENLHPRIVESNLQTTHTFLNRNYPCPYQQNAQCNYNYNCSFNDNNNCQYKINNKENPDNNIDMDIEQENQINKSLIDNDLTKLFDLKDILYQNNSDNLGFFIESRIYTKPNFNNNIESEDNFVTEWAKNNNFKSFNFKLKEINDGYRFVDVDASHTYNVFKIPIVNREKFNQFSCEVGLGITDINGKYHYLSAKYDNYKNMDCIKYATSFNNNYKTQKEGYNNITGIVAYVINMNYKKIIVFFVEENGVTLHYFHHIILSGITNIFIYMSDKLISENQQVIDYFTCDTLKNNVIAFETPFVFSYKKDSSPILKNGDNWTNLYRIDSNQSSYTYIHNTSNAPLMPDNIILHFEDINIPNESIIKDIKLKTLVNTSTNLNIQSYCATQTNNNFEEAISNNIVLYPNNIECYPANKESQYYYQSQINIATQNNNTKLAQYNENNLKKNQLFNEAVNINLEDYINNFNSFVEVNKGFWIELSDFTHAQTNCNNIEYITFVLEGYNNGPENNLSYQLLCLNESMTKHTVKINSGYFYTKIKVPFSNSFVLDKLRLRFRFDNLNHDIQLFNSYMDISFKNKEQQFVNYYLTDDVLINNKQNIDINCLHSSFTPEQINNGLTIELRFDELSPGEFYRLYSAELEIIYQNTSMNILINKNQFNYIQYENAYTSISGLNTDTYMSGLFYNDVPTVLQLESTIDADNHGIELKEAIFQSFIARDDNITSIELFPNGFVGSPDDTIKIGLYSNHGNTPGHLIKEVYANGWTKSNNQLKNLASIKYNFNIDDIKIDEKYWIKIEVENPNDNSYYLLRYTTENQKNFKLLLRENNDYINTFGCLEFNIYSRNISKSFHQLPTVQEYFNNPYILIGLHKGVGNIQKLRVKNKGVDNETND